MEELQLARLDGRTYEDIQPDIIKLVNYYVNLWYKNYPVLDSYGYDSEQIVMDVYHGIYLKTQDDGLSNLERHFIKASKIPDCTMKYMSNLIKNSVLMMLKCRARDVVRKPLCSSLDKEVYQEENKPVTLGDMVASPGESIEVSVETKLLLESIPNEIYPTYYTRDFFGAKKKLSTKLVLNWIISGYKTAEMCEMVIDKETKEHISYTRMSKIRKETILQARKLFYED